MYITYNEKDYTCDCKIGEETIYSGLPEDFPSHVSGEITLKANDGFILRTDVAEDYLYQRFENGILTLSNIPENEKPEPIVVDDITTEDMAKAIKEGVSDI